MDYVNGVHHLGLQEFFHDLLKDDVEGGDEKRHDNAKSI